MLELKDISKSYTTGDFTQKALDKVSVTFRDSEFVAVLGPSGSGKTTMLNVIGGLDHYDSGDLLINGTSTNEYKDNDWDHYRNNQVGFVFQNYNLIPHQSVLSNVELALTLSGISSTERKRRAKNALIDVGLKEHINKKPNQLSGGQMQRVAIARAIVNNPNIIFADEPTGALDTKTSVQIMDILKKISKDKLVVMVTHNPELAEKYATRIVNLKDSKIVGDSKPYKKDDEPAKINKPRKLLEKGKTAMSFMTALSLSFANLMGKKGRTFMTAFAGSIGIIGISAILALSTGTNEYIKNVENNTLSQYPLNITRSKSVISEFADMSNGGGISDMIKDMRTNNQEENKIGVRTFLSKMLSTAGNNDLKSFKTFLESNPDNINSQINSIEYSYAAKPLIYTNDQAGLREVYPEGTLSSVSGSSGSSASMSSASGMGMGTNSMGSTTGFAQLPKNDSLYKDVYSVAAGKWPENPYECVLVLHQDGTINDSLLFTLGIRDNNELMDALKNYSKQEKVNLPEEYDDLNFSAILGKKFKLINACDTYTYNSEAEIWEEKTEDKAFMQQKYEEAADLTIVGIINPPEGNNTALALTAGINYTCDLSEKCIEYAGNSQLVKDQLKNKDLDILTGKTFFEEKQNNSIDPNIMGSIMSVDPNGLKNAFKMDDKFNFNPDININQEDITNIITSALTPDVIAQIVGDIAQDQKYSQAMTGIIIKAVNMYNEAHASYSTLTPETYFSTGDGKQYIIQACSSIGLSPTFAQKLAEVSSTVCMRTVNLFTNEITKSLSNIGGNLSAMNQGFNFDSSALKDMFKIDLSPEKLMQMSKLISGSKTRSYDTNLANFGYADLSNPLGITIYPNDFYSKEKISATIDKYNNENSDNGQEDKVISYSDYAKLLMSSITTMIDMITAVLVAFVAISLVVSSIMIGIITYISVLERRREIGILRAIGARKFDIFSVFNAETFIIGLIAGFIGILVTAIGCIPVNLIAKAVFDVEYDIAILSIPASIILIFISVFLTFVAGLIPSTSAAKKDPVEAINS